MKSLPKEDPRGIAKPATTTKPVVVRPMIMVAAKANDLSLPSSTPTLISDWMITSDEHKMFDVVTGSCIVPETGLYRINLCLFFYISEPTYKVGEILSTMLYRNGVSVISSHQHTSGISNMHSVSFSRTFQLTKGDTLQPYAVQYTTSAQRISGSTMNNWFSIERV
jgi:hypothetical protein